MSENGVWEKVFGSVACLLGMSIIVLWFFRESRFVPELILWLAVMTALSGVLALAGSPFVPRTQRERVVGRVRVLRDPAIEPSIPGQVDKLEGWIRGS